MAIKIFNKVSILENLDSIFTCSNCYDAKSNQPFSTSTASLFLEHQRCHHSSLSDFECIYCCCRVSISISVQHILAHFGENNQSSCKSINCRSCSKSLHQDKCNLVEHINNYHPDDIQCPHCSIKFISTQDLVNHLSNNILVLYHCTFDKCLVKSHSKQQMLNHLKNKHNGAQYFRVECQYICTERGVYLTVAPCPCEIDQSSSVNQLSNEKSNYPMIISDINNNTNQRLSPLTTSFGMNNNGTTNIKLQSQKVKLPYSPRVLSKLAINLDESVQESLRLKMEQYSKYYVLLEPLPDGQKQFVCNTCHYRSVHSLADVRKHILGCHCSVSTSYTRLCLRASRLDTNTLELFSDRKLISFANEKLRRKETSVTHVGAGGASNMSNLNSVSMVYDSSLNSTLLLDDSEPESLDNEATSGLDDSSTCGSKKIKRATPFSYNGFASGTTSAAGISSKKQKLSGSTQKHKTHQPASKMRPDSPIPEVGPPLQRSEPLERIIALNFSWNVLTRLIGDQCPQEYLPILQAKMQAYSKHCILLTRRAGKRYFLCSHCSNSSPHGMNDIRKHILGVHARLPERFKTAAMYCSRMNRDNYTLLSDEELFKKRDPPIVLPSHTNNNNNNINRVLTQTQAITQTCTSPMEHTSPDSPLPLSPFIGTNSFLDSSCASLSHITNTILPNPINSSPSESDKSSSNTPQHSNNNNNNINNNKGQSRRSLVLKKKLQPSQIVFPTNQFISSDISDTTNHSQYDFI